jgi:hypothetical protein
LRFASNRFLPAGEVSVVDVNRGPVEQDAR